MSYQLEDILENQQSRIYISTSQNVFLSHTWGYRGRVPWLL